MSKKPSPKKKYGPRAVAVPHYLNSLTSDVDPENRGIYTQSDSSKKSSRNIWSLAIVSVDQRY